MEDTVHHALLQFRIVNQIEGSWGISQVHRINTAVTVVFLRQPQQVTVGAVSYTHLDVYQRQIYAKLLYPLRQ